MGGKPKYKSSSKKHKNLVWLYPREHYIAHKLLMEEYPNNANICAAFWYMTVTNDGKYITTPEEYEAAKTA